MALSDDQRALLRLLAGREEGYEDIAALKGKSVDEVRAEVKEALAGLKAEEAQATAPAEPAPAPPPAERAPEPQPAPEPAAPPEPKVSQPEVGAPRPTARRPRPQVPPERRRIVLLAGGALAVVAIAIGAIALFSGDSDSDSGSASGTETTAFADTPAAKNAKVTRAILEPVDGGEGEGLAIFGRVGKQVRLAVAAKGLEPAPSGKAYVVWLANPANHMLPVNAVSVNGSGEIAAQYPVPAAVLVSLAEGAFSEIDVTLVSAGRYKVAFARARKEGKFPTYTGTDVLRGPIAGPIIDASKKSGG